MGILGLGARDEPRPRGQIRDPGAGAGRALACSGVQSALQQRYRAAGDLAVRRLGAP
jgi:hypothetical protein